MGITANDNEKFHSIRVKLYKNKLPGIKGEYLARTDDEASLTIRDVCTSMKKRGGFGGNEEVLAASVIHFLDEVAYQLCNGFPVNLKYFSVYPNIGGTFDSVNDAHDPQKNPISFKVRSNKLLRDLAKHTIIDIDGIAPEGAFIRSFMGKEGADESSRQFIPGDIFCLTGKRIKVAGDDPDCGVFFVPVEDPSKAVKVRRIAENRSGKIIGIAVDTGFGENRIEVRTQYTGSSSYLKSPRVIASSFTIEAS